MRKSIMVCLLLLSISFSSKAQDSFDELQGNTTFTIKGGLLQSNIRGSDLNYLTKDGKTSRENNFFIGVSVDNGISKYFGLKHELFYQQYGS